MDRLTLHPPPELPFARDFPSPALVLDLARIDRNLRSMLDLVGDPGRLRVHLKTHKMPALVQRCEALGITKHKCATIAEAEMAAQVGATDVLVAYPLVGPNVSRLIQLIKHYPETLFRATVDSRAALEDLEREADKAGVIVPVSIDLDVGMGRTGIAPVSDAYGLVRSLAQSPSLKYDGIHAYDGHVREPDPDARTLSARSVELMVQRFREQLEGEGIRSPRVVVGGTPTFPAHAQWESAGVECSPGTCVLHDAGYARAFPDLPFEPAAFLLTRVISHPGAGRVCLDLGHKAVAGDQPLESRAFLLGIEDGKIVAQSEEHLVVATARTAELSIGRRVWAIPGHVCPTVALHACAMVITGESHVERWEVTARDRVLNI
jgi:D-serine deaminase-like pyridoxal phosphate-dependent protein